MIQEVSDYCFGLGILFAQRLTRAVSPSFRITGGPGQSLTNVLHRHSTCFLQILNVSKQLSQSLIGPFSRCSMFLSSMLSSNQNFGLDTSILYTSDKRAFARARQMSGVFGAML